MQKLLPTIFIIDRYHLKKQGLFKKFSYLLSVNQIFE